MGCFTTFATTRRGNWESTATKSGEEGERKLHRPTVSKTFKLNAELGKLVNSVRFNGTHAEPFGAELLQSAN